MGENLELALVAGLVLLAAAYLVWGAFRRFRGRSCGGSCSCGDQASPESKSATLTVRNKPVLRD